MIDYGNEDKNIVLKQEGSNFKLNLANQLSIKNGITVGDSQLSSMGLSIAQGPSVTQTGIDAGNKTISNIAEGVNAQDAINKGQLDQSLQDAGLFDSQGAKLNVVTYDGDGNVRLKDKRTGGRSTLSNVAEGVISQTSSDAINGRQLHASTSSIAKALGGGSTVDDKGNVKAPNYTVAGKTVSNVGAALSNIDSRTMENTVSLNNINQNLNEGLLSVSANGMGAQKVAKDAVIDYGNEDKNIVLKQEGSNFKLNLADQLSIKKGIAVGNVVTNGVTNIISGLSAGSLKKGSTEAVIGGQIRNIIGRAAFNNSSESGVLSNIGGTGKNNISDAIQTINNAIQNLEASSRGDNVHYKENPTSSNNIDYNHIEFASKFTSNKDVITNKIKTTGGTHLSHVASAGDYTSVNNASKAVNAADLNNAVLDVTDKGIKFSANSSNGPEMAYTADLGTTVSIKGKNENKDFSKSDYGNNIYTQLEHDGVLRIGLAQNLNLGDKGSLSIGNTTVRNGVVEGLANTVWNSSNIKIDRAATEGQLKSALSQIKNQVVQVSDNAVQYAKNDDGIIDKNRIVLAGGVNGTSISNVANGEISSGSKDAINGGQLWNLTEVANKNASDINHITNQVTKNTTSITNIENKLSNSGLGLVQQSNETLDINVATNIQGKNINITGTEGNRVIKGVATGKNDDDAVNVGQLNSISTEIAKFVGGGAGYDNITQSFNAPNLNVGDKTYNNVGSAINALNTTDMILDKKITSMDAKLNQSFQATNKRIDSVEKQANAGIAAAIAMESAPYISGKFTYAVGAATHARESAVGATFRRTADSGRWAVTAGFAVATQGEPSVRVGVSGVIN